MLMNKFLRLSFVALLSFVYGNLFADVITFTPGEFEAVTSSDYSLTKNGVTLSVTASTVTADQFRIFKGQTATITSTGEKITLVEFTCTANGDEKYGPGNLEATDSDINSTELAENAGPHYWWTGSVSELKIAAVENQVRASKIMVYTGKDGEEALKELWVNEIGFVYAILFVDKGIGDFTIENVKLGEGLSYVWKEDSQYGMKASAYNKKNIESESWLISPVIDLTGIKMPSAGFTQAINKYFGDVTQEATVWLREVGGEWKQVQVTYPAIPEGKSFSDLTAMDAYFEFSLEGYEDKKIQIGFKYTSTNEHAGTWEIFDFSVIGLGGTFDPSGDDDPVQTEVKSVAEALTIIDGLEDGKTTSEEYEVKGFVVGDPDFQRKADGTLYGNVNLDIADEKGGTSKLTIYRAKSFNNQLFTEETISLIKDGDEVVFKGKLQKYVKDGNVTPELAQGGYLISVNGNTGVVDIVKNAQAPSQRYNLAGQRVDANYRGMVMVKGRKFYQK